jgi:hypothetical protein
MQKITQLKQTQGPSRQAATRLAVRTHLRAGKDCSKVYVKAYEKCIAEGMQPGYCADNAQTAFTKCTLNN